MLHFSSFQGRNKKKKGLYFLLYFFIAVGLRAIDFFVSGFNCLQLIIRIFCNTGNGLLPGNNLECTVSALVLFQTRESINTWFLRYKILKGRKLLQNSVYILWYVYFQRYLKLQAFLHIYSFVTLLFYHASEHCNCFVLFCFVLSRGMHLRKKIPFAKIPYISERRNGEILSSWCQVMQVQMEQTSFTQCPEHGSLFLGRFAGKMMMIHVKNKAQLLEQQEPTEAGLIK